MYQYSLQWFQKLFTIAIDTSPKAEDLEERLGILKSFFTEQLYQSICRGLFEKETDSTDPRPCQNKRPKQRDGRAMTTTPKQEPRDKTLFSFALCTSILRGDKMMDDTELRFLLVGPTADLVENGPAIPAEWPRKLSPLQKICFIRAMRIDCLKAAVISFISNQILGSV
eukprot:g32199.t1